MKFNKENFTMQTMLITDDGEGWNSTLRSVFISDAQMAQQYRTLVGHIHIPIIKDGDNKPRCKLVNVKDPRCVVQRMVELNLFQNFLKSKNLKGTDYKYVIITYTGKREEEWFAYANLLMKFVDYILPYIVKNISVITIDNLVFTEHAKPNTGSTTFHVLFTADEATEFQQLWTMYIEYNEKKEKKLEESKNNASETENDNAENNGKETVSQHSENKQNSESKNTNKNNVETEKVGDVTINKETGEVIEENHDNSHEQESVEDIPSDEELDDEEDFSQEIANENNDPGFGDDDEGIIDDSENNVEAISFNEPDEDEYAEPDEEE